MADQTVIIIDSLNFTSAFTKGNASALESISDSIRLVLAPINTGIHWYLIAANFLNRMITIYDVKGDQHAQFLAEFVELTISETID